VRDYVLDEAPGLGWRHGVARQLKAPLSARFSIKTLHSLAAPAKTVVFRPASPSSM
jgi:hypothetical protein